MSEYIGLDVSLKETAICVRRNAKRVWRDKCASDPAIIARVLCKHAPRSQAGRVRDGPVVDLVLALPDGSRAAGDLHRCVQCQGRPRHGAQQDRRQ